MGALGHLLRDLGSLLGDLGSVLGDLDSVLGRSWGALGSLLGGLGGPREPWPAILADQGREILPPPVGNSYSGPPPSRQFHYFLRPREEENETMDLKNRRSKVQGRDGRRVHGRDGRKEERDDGRRVGGILRTPRWPRGPADICMYIYVYIMK